VSAAKKRGGIVKLASFVVSGRQTYGIVRDDGVVDAGRRLGEKFPTLLDVLAAGALPDVARIDATAKGADHALADVTLAMPIVAPQKIICIGRNYRDHVLEGAGEIPKQPSVFIRTLDSFAPPEGALVCPRVSDNFDYEGELALVIGKGGRHIPAASALQHIAGYTCLNDGSIRDFQFGHSLTVGKNFHRSGSIGPWMATSDAIPDPTRLTLLTRLNGREVQHATTDHLIFDIPFLIQYLSAAIELLPGDIIATGTPEGVGFARKPPLWMKAGDVIEIEISGIGTLRNGVVAEA
jgi:2-keto-4-pentenoate hydratase/2-oxohepta-3-ene-1,7-dioic acid hydratase in catechol pathway